MDDGGHLRRHLHQPIRASDHSPLQFEPGIGRRRRSGRLLHQSHETDSGGRPVGAERYLFDELVAVDEHILGDISKGDVDEWREFDTSLNEIGDQPAHFRERSARRLAREHEDFLHAGANPFPTRFPVFKHGDPFADAGQHA